MPNKSVERETKKKSALYEVAQSGPNKGEEEGILR